MTDERLADVERELERFTAALAALKAARTTVFEGREYQHSSYPPVESGAARRSSMDLTRALARFRRP